MWATPVRLTRLLGSDLIGLLPTSTLLARAANRCPNLVTVDLNSVMALLERLAALWTALKTEAPRCRMKLKNLVLNC